MIPWLTVCYDFIYLYVYKYIYILHYGMIPLFGQHGVVSPALYKYTTFIH